MNGNNTAPPRRRARRGRRLLAAIVVAVASVVVAVAPSTPASAGTTQTCSDFVRIGDVDAKVCWDWYWVSTFFLWQPTAFHLVSKDASKSLYILIKTTPTNDPDEVYLGRRDGNANWAVPTSYSWDMFASRETTTTYVARRLPGRSADCLARFRHDSTAVWFIKPLSGSC